MNITHIKQTSYIVPTSISVTNGSTHFEDWTKVSEKSNFLNGDEITQYSLLVRRQISEEHFVNELKSVMVPYG